MTGTSLLLRLQRGGGGSRHNEEEERCRSPFRGSSLKNVWRSRMGASDSDSLPLMGRRNEDGASVGDMKKNIRVGDSSPARGRPSSFDLRKAMSSSNKRSNGDRPTAQDPQPNKDGHKRQSSDPSHVTAITGTSSPTSQTQPPMNGTASEENDELSIVSSLSGDESQSQLEELDHHTDPPPPVAAVTVPAWNDGDDNISSASFVLAKDQGSRQQRETGATLHQLGIATSKKQLSPKRGSTHTHGTLPPPPPPHHNQNRKNHPNHTNLIFPTRMSARALPPHGPFRLPETVMAGHHENTPLPAPSSKVARPSLRRAKSEEPSDGSSASSIRTGMSARSPSRGRGGGMGADALSVARSHRSVFSASSVPYERGGATLGALPPNHRDCFSDHSASPTNFDDLVSNNNSEDAQNPPDKMLRGRPRHRRVNTGSSISVGSIVGHSSFTGPSTQQASNLGGISSNDAWAMQSISSTSLSGVVAAQHAALNAHNMTLAGMDDGYSSVFEREIRRKNVVKEELKYMLGKVSTPIKKMGSVATLGSGGVKTGSGGGVNDPRKVKLQRASGCLT